MKDQLSTTDNARCNDPPIGSGNLARRKLFVCGPIAYPDAPAAGGFESSNLRLIKTLSKTGYLVDGMRYGDVSGDILMKSGTYIAAFSKILAKILFKISSGSVIHFTPLARHFLPIEVLLVIAASIRNLGIVIDLRAGSQENQYNSRGLIYRFLFRLLLKRADAISFEAEVYNDFVQKIAPKTPKHVLPNFIPSSIIRDEGIKQTVAGPNFVYVGYVSEEKGAIHAAHVIKELRKKNLLATLTLIGDIEKDCKKKLEDFQVQGIKLTGPLRFEEIRPILDESHYFIFLTKWKGEGHSNALTEAMGHGCVPICTNHGFNKQVVGDAGMVIEDREEIDKISAAIVNSWKTDFYFVQSNAARKRVRDKYSDIVVVKKLDLIYNKVFRKIEK